MACRSFKVNIHIATRKKHLCWIVNTPHSLMVKTQNAPENKLERFYKNNLGVSAIKINYRILNANWEPQWWTCHYAAGCKIRGQLKNNELTVDSWKPDSWRRRIQNVTPSRASAAENIEYSCRRCGISGFCVIRIWFLAVISHHHTCRAFLLTGSKRPRFGRVENSASDATATETCDYATRTANEKLKRPRKSYHRTRLRFSLIVG